MENPTSPFLTPGAAYMLQYSPLLALGTLDKEGKPWTTIWGGEPGFSRPIAHSIIGIKTLVDRKNDPVVETLLGASDDGEVIREESKGRMVSGLAIDLASRRRVKLAGRMVAGALGQLGGEGEVDESAKGEMQLVVKIEQSLGNCPKYLNSKHIYPSLPEPKLISSTPHLPQQAIDLLSKSDLFFISSSNRESDMDTNYRGGPPGFVRVLNNDSNGTAIVYPEYSGNRLYQTLGNLQTTPQAGLVFPDLDTGDVLYVTGTTEILVGKDAATLLPRSNLAVKVTITASRFVEKGLAFRGHNGERSPYNPPVRFLSTERAMPDTQAKNSTVVYAKLLKKAILTPTIARFRFSISDPIAAGRWKPGQYVALAFEDELSIGYSHMREDDPRSLNDDYMRTFTVSSAPGGDMPEDEFEITVRKIGGVTGFLFRQSERTALEIPLKGFGGLFAIEQSEEELVSFVAGGIGITPLLAQLPALDISRLRVFWTLSIRDIGLVSDTFNRHPSLRTSTNLFITGDESKLSEKDKKLLLEVTASGAKVERRRMLGTDLETESPRWYICTGTGLRKSLIEWLVGKEVIYEDFNY
ncbi:MAG: hypothetical protein M1830_010752 [Pleopsidium flavum]|nr:MAG: hypothetical protein M1830_010752 [Pleopsidium flavum]